MSAFDRLEIISGIESMAHSLGMTDLTVLQKLPDLTDGELGRLFGALDEVSELTREHQ